jgi:hypothetical protein
MHREVAIWELTLLILHESTLVAARSKAWVYGRSLAGIADSIPARAWMPVSCELRCHVEVSATSSSLVLRSPTDCGVSECDLGTS